MRLVTFFRVAAVLVASELIFNLSVRASGLDTSFDPGSGPDGTIMSLALQPDGKILVAGSFTNFGGLRRPQIARLNADGMIDPSFNWTPAPYVGPISVLSYPGVKAIVVGRLGPAGLEKVTVRRINSDGTIDTSFAGIEELHASGVWAAPDGKVLLAGLSVSGSGLLLLNADGEVDPSFQPAVDLRVRDLVFQADGKMIASGEFRRGEFAPLEYLARLNADGSYDETFRPAAERPFHRCPSHIHLEPSGKVLVFTDDGTIERLLPDGSVDPSFSSISLSDLWYSRLTFDQANRIYLRKPYSLSSPGGELIRLNPDGSRDWTFTLLSGVDIVTLQPDGKPIIAGPFTNIAGVPRRQIARLLESPSEPVFHFMTNSYDTSETNAEVVLKVVRGGDSNSAVSIGVRTVEVRALAGKDYVAQTSRIEFLPGEQVKTFSVRILEDSEAAEGQERFRVVLENPSAGASIGTPASAEVSIDDPDPFVDEGFNPPENMNPSALALLPDGKLLFAGWIVEPEGTFDRFAVVRLNPDGSRDSSFDPEGRLNVGRVQAITPEANGTVLIAGRFTNVAGFPRASIARLRPDGSVDEGFVPPPTLQSTHEMALQRDGRILIRSSISIGSQGVSIPLLRRLNVDGSTDGSFVPDLGSISNSVSGFLVQADGRIVVGGESEREMDGTLVRLNENGSRDATFRAAGSYAYRPVLLEPDGRILAVKGKTGCYSAAQLVRLLANGSDDSSWHAPIFCTYPPLSHLECPYLSFDVVLSQPDGRIVVAGAFEDVNKCDFQNPRGLVRLNPDGSLDLGYNPPGFFAAPIPAFSDGALQPDGKLILGGFFRFLGNPTRTDLVRLPAGAPLITAARFEEILPKTNGVVELTVRFEGSSYYVIDASSNLGHWSPIHTNTTQEVIQTFSESGSAVGAQRYYRVRPWD